jgi:hypothetical protein
MMKAFESFSSTKSRSGCNADSDQFNSDKVEVSQTSESIGGKYNSVGIGLGSGFELSSDEEQLKSVNPAISVK